MVKASVAPLALPWLFARALALLAATATGCGTPRGPHPRSADDAALFAPVTMRVHPVFTDVKDWTGDAEPDGIEALLEFQDQFGDPTKASGTVVFELFSYRPYHPDSRGERVVNPWLGSLQALADQQARWNRTSRTYQFQLAFPRVSAASSYVLTATFDTGTTRFFDQIVLEGRDRPGEDDVIPATRPSPVSPAGPSPGLSPILTPAPLPGPSMSAPPAATPATSATSPVARERPAASPAPMAAPAPAPVMPLPQ